MKWLEKAIAQRLAARGPGAAWEFSAAAVVAPYLVLVSSIEVAAVPVRIALSLALAFSLGLLAVLRGAMTVDLSSGTQRNGQSGDDTLLGEREQDITCSAATGLPVRDCLRVVVESYDIDRGPALFGYVRFCNHAAMCAYDPAAARTVMLEFGRRLLAAAGAARPVAQVAEDGFALLFAGPTDASSAEAELRSIAYVLSQEIQDTRLTVAPDIHVGAAWLRNSFDTFSGLISAAEATLTPLKRFSATRSKAAVAADADLANRFAIEQALRCAVREGQLYLQYQPLIDTQAGKIAGAEALLRWVHPQFGNVSPARFVPILEETGLIHEIGLWTLNTGCRQLSQWRARGDDLRLAINLSAVQLQNDSLRSVIERVVAAHGLVPGDIELELTETAAMEDQKRTLDLFQDLRAQGFGIAIDDFGNGHSNLSYLKNLPFTKLKIDREFVDQVDTRPGSQAICKALVELGDGLGISVLAEGVERLEEVNTLRRLGCHVFQGFYFARPLSADDMTARLADLSWAALLKSDVHRSHAELQKRMLS